MDEISRIRALHEQAVLDTGAEARFDRLAAMAAKYFDAPIALISLLDSDRQWFKACVGLGSRERETPRDQAFCSHAIELGERQIMVVEDATKDSRFLNNPFVTGEPHIRFYAGATLTTEDGANLGTLCVIDTKPRSRPSDLELAHLRNLADLVIDQIELSRARKILDDRHLILDMAEQLSLVGYWTLNTQSGDVFWSPQVYAIHGVDDLAHRPGLDDALSFYVEEDRERIRALIAKANAKGEGWSFDATIIRQDGSERSVRSVAECQKDGSGRVKGFIGVFKDLTDERRVIAEAVEKERRYRLLADHASDVIAVYDVSGKFSYLSPSVFELLGYTPEELVGRTPYDLIVEEDHARVTNEFLLAASSHLPAAVEYRVLTKDGRILWLEARPRYRRNEKGQIVEITDSVRDVTERRQRETSLAVARAAAENAARVKSEFLANMSHEIRTPMNGVMGFTELLGGTPLDAEQRRYVDMIADSGRSMMQLLNDILDVSKIEAGQMRLAAEPVDIRHKLRSVVSLMEPAAAAKGISISSMIDDALPSLIVGDQLRLRQILMNLVGNAVKFTQHGRVMLAATKTVDDAGASLLIEVRDTGIGIPADCLETIFEKFSQADTSIARDFGGTGLGLSITKKLIELMGGTLSVVSKVGKGTTFAVHLPLLLPLKSAEPVLRIVESPERIVAHGRPSARILVVEDHDINQALMQGLGKQLCTDLEIAANGEEALMMVHEAHVSDRPYDLVLMDMQMPVMDGLEATRRLRAQGFSPENLPIVALTANAFAEDVAACLKAGMQDHISKPVRKRDLQRLFNRFTDRRSPEKGRDIEVEDSPLDEAIFERFQEKFLKRKQQTLEFLAQLASSRGDRKADYEQMIEMLHNLAGTAEMFGEPALGDAASKVEHALRTARPEHCRDVVRAGWKQLSQVC